LNAEQSVESRKSKRQRVEESNLNDLGRDINVLLANFPANIADLSALETLFPPINMTV